MTNQSTRTVKLSDSHSVVHDGRRYEFRAKRITVGDYQEWVRQVDERDPRSRSVIADIEGNPPSHHPDAVVDACVGELGRHYNQMFSGLSAALKASLNNLGVGINERFLNLGREPCTQAPLVLLRMPEERVIDAIYDLRDSLREESVPLAHASLRWARDKVLPGLIVLLVGLVVGWAANEFLG